MGSTRCATVKLEVRDWTMEYEAGGLRTKRTSDEKTYKYIYSGDKKIYANSPKLLELAMSAFRR